MPSITITVTPIPAVTDEQADTTTLPPPAPVLPPQTTPFVPSPGPEACELSVYCSFLSQYVYQTIAEHGGHPLGGEQCTAAQTSKFSAGSVMAHISRCYPDGYFDIFNTLTLRPRQDGASAAAAAQKHEEEEERGSTALDSALAYPGSACMSGWTTACTTTVTQGGRGYPQAWCCPPGEWACARAEGDRRCSSILTGRTAIWLTWDPAFTSLDGYEWYTYPTWVKSEAVENAATVWHDVFPLQMTVAAGGGGGRDGAVQLQLQPTARDDNNNNQSIATIGVAVPPLTRSITLQDRAAGAGAAGSGAGTTSGNRALVAAAAAVLVVWPLATLIMLMKRRRHVKKKRTVAIASAGAPTYRPEGVSLRSNLRPEGALS
ncbi:hypothetical protein SLS62_000825 [Diatrype stigma]|uniref:Uncharacterized protein n=1 Tax=Diatrype stigma TaxID=117547 RepID=A0AAN9V162_9PEZI